ncbi:MAG: cell division protein ZapA [Desulfobacteraceae bacterium]
MDQLLTIEVLGQPFTFKSDSDASESRAVADYVADTVKRVKSQCAQNTPTPDKRAILILTALNITSEYFELKKKHQQLLHDIDTRSVNLLNALEARTQSKDAETV